jgi:hypothetical protein
VALLNDDRAYTYYLKLIALFTNKRSVWREVFIYVEGTHYVYFVS